MKYCTNCGAQLPDDAKFCTSCGSPQEVSASENTPVEKQDVTQEQDPDKNYQEEM